MLFMGYAPNFVVEITKKEKKFNRLILNILDWRTLTITTFTDDFSFELSLLEQAQRNVA